MLELPSGTVTFLFTDIEGSTRLWEEQPSHMRMALARHDALVRQAIESNRGVVFKTVGDAFCGAFAMAADALEAALKAQRSLLTDNAPLPFRVRMALHTGSVENREGDYFGAPSRPLGRYERRGVLLRRRDEQGFPRSRRNVTH